MKLSSGKRIGQSGQELVTATIFSFALHVLTVAAAVSLYFTTSPRAYVPPFYDVKLVGQIADAPQTLAPPTVETPQSMPKAKPEAKPAEKTKKTRTREHKAPARTKKGAMPELAKATPKHVTAEQEKPPGPVPEQKSAPAAAASQGAATPGVNMAIPEGFKPEFQPYLERVRTKVGVNWNPPPGDPETKVQIQFTILRSGRVGDVKLVESSGNFYFDQAAVRAILASSPFPPLPDSFYKEYELFSVDLMEKE